MVLNYRVIMSDLSRLEDGRTHRYFIVSILIVFLSASQFPDCIFHHGQFVYLHECRGPTAVARGGMHTVGHKSFASYAASE